ncbi:MAG TPA: holo-ACP synthase [Symbiobacteriaceae bacterium]|nr:holo-ACP synthase [Symbiobacteriaceae bacterium]
MRIGVDLVDAGRLRRMLETHPALREQVFTAEELAHAGELPDARRAEFLGGRFAAKEAVMKALGTGMTGDVRFTEIETRQMPSGAPVLQLFGAALATAQRMGLQQFEVSISHDAGMAIAFVVLH